MLPLRKIIQEAIFLAENLQQAEKVYFKPGKLSPEVKKYITHITGGDAYTKIITDIYYAMLQSSIKTGRWAVSQIGGGDDEEEIDPRDTKDHLHTDNDVLPVDDWKKIRGYHNQFKEYDKNVFPIKNFNINGVSDIWDFIRALKERATILELIKQLPSVATRNMRGDIRTERDSGELREYKSNLEHVLSHLQLLSNRSEKMKQSITDKMFSSKNVSLEDLMNFVEEKENLLGGAKVTKNQIKKVVSENDELEIIYSKGDVMVVEVTGPDGIKNIGCTSLWCFTYGSGFDGAWRNWNNYSTNGYVYVIIDFSEQTDSPDFMHVLIKPIDFETKTDDDFDRNEGDSNDSKLFNMANEESYNAIGVLTQLVGLDNVYNLFLFGEEPLSPEDRILRKHQGEKSPWPYQDPNQTKLDLKEFRRYVRAKLLEEAHLDSDGTLQDFEFKQKYPFDKIKKFIDWFQREYGDYAAKQGWAIFDSDTEAPNEKYHSERAYGGKILTGYYWQIQRLDSPGEGEALFGKLPNDYKADELAEKLGLMIDEYGVVIGYKGQSFLEKENINEVKSKFKKLQDNKVPLTDEERKQVMDADAVWHHGPNGKATPAVWKSKDKEGKITYVTNTHRAFQARPTLKGAISIYHSFIKGTS